MSGNSSSNEVTPAVLPGLNIPSPHRLRVTIEEELSRLIREARAERGEVQLPEETYPLVRALVASHELLSDYASAFKKAASTAQQEVESELLDAVGEQEGQPVSGMTVPDARGDIRVSLDTANEYDIDMDALRNVVCLVVGELHGNGGAESADLALSMLLSMGSFTPQVSKVRAFAQDTSRKGEDGLAATITSAIRKVTRYKGVKTARKK